LLFNDKKSDVSRTEVKVYSSKLRIGHARQVQQCRALLYSVFLTVQQVPTVGEWLKCARIVGSNIEVSERRAFAATLDTCTVYAFMLVNNKM